MPKNMLQGIIDTNVLIRANITENGSDYAIYKAFLNNKLELIYSDVLLKELKEVLNYSRIFKKYSFTQKKINTFLMSIAGNGKFVFAPKKLKICRDPDGDELLSIAKAIYHKNPVCIVSDDEDLQVIKNEIRFAKVVTPNEFLKLL